MPCIERLNLSMSGCSHSECHAMADTGYLHLFAWLMIPDPKQALRGTDFSNHPVDVSKIQQAWVEGTSSGW